jgi:hypothetical protein
MLFLSGKYYILLFGIVSQTYYSKLSAKLNERPKKKMNIEEATGPLPVLFDAAVAYIYVCVCIIGDNQSDVRRMMPTTKSIIDVLLCSF